MEDPRLAQLPSQICSAKCLVLQVGLPNCSLSHKHMWLLKKSFGVFPQKTRRARMPYKLLRRLYGEAFFPGLPNKMQAVWNEVRKHVRI